MKFPEHRIIRRRFRFSFDLWRVQLALKLEWVFFKGAVFAFNSQFLFSEIIQIRKLMSKFFLCSNFKWKEIYIQVIWIVKDNENESSEKFLIAGLRTMPVIKIVGWISEKIKFLKPIVFCWIDKSYKSNAKIVFLFRKWGLKFRKIWKLGQIVAKLCGSICKFSGFERLNVGFKVISECN